MLTRISMSKKLLAVVQEGARSATTTNSPLNAVWHRDGSLFLNVLAKPGAKQSAITEITDTHIGVHLAARAQEGEANSELIRTIAAALGVPKGRVSIQRGHRGREKVLRVSDQSESVDTNEIQMLLQAKIGQQF